MTTEKETGENLVEQVEQKQEETPQEEKGFDAQAFMGDNKPNENIEQPKEEESEKAEEVKEETEEVSEEDSNEFAWGGVEKKEAEASKEEEDWDTPVKVEETENKETPVEIDWSSMGKELGIDAKDKESFKAAVSKAMTENVQPNDTMTTLQGYLKMSDRDLVLSDLKASGLTKEEANDTLIRIQDSGLLKREALNARKQINAYVTQEREKIRRESALKKQQQEKNALEERKRLQGYLKDKGEFFGGKIAQNEKRELYNYIVSGDFANEVYSNHANVADAAFLWRYKDKIFKMLRGQGMETGKAAILDKITNPDLGRKTGRVEIKQKAGFDPSEFAK